MAFASLTLVFSSANLTNMITKDFGAYNSSLSTSTSYKLDAAHPEQAVLYFQQSFTNIFETFLSQDDSDNASDGLLGSTSSSSSNSSFDPFSSGYDYYSKLIALQSGSSTSSSSLELLNSSANLIDKEAIYSFRGQRLVGVIQSVVNDNGGIYFRIDGDLIPIDNLLEVRKAGSSYA